MHIHDIHLDAFPPFRMGFDPNFYAEWMLLSDLTNRKCVPEPEIIWVIRRVVKPGDVVIDGGANIGFFSMLMAPIVGDTGRVIAFEPAPPNIEKFKQNRDLNRFTNVALYTDALWSEVGEADFYVGADTGQSALWSSVDSREVGKTRLLPLDAIAPPLANGVKFMKLDVEGAEEKALRGAGSLLKRGFPTYIVCELNSVAMAQLGGDQDGLRTYMALHGYDTFLLREDGGWPSLVPDGIPIRPTKQNFNILFATMESVRTAWPEAVA